MNKTIFRVDKELLRGFCLAFPFLAIVPVFSSLGDKLLNNSLDLQAFHDVHPWVLSLVLQMLLLALSTGIYFAYKAAGIFDIEVKPKKYTTKADRMFVIKAVCALETVSYLVVALFSQAVKPFTTSVSTGGSLSGLSPLDCGFYLLEISFITAIYEELTMRKYLYEIFRKFGAPVAILCTSIAFSVTHESFAQIFSTFLAGVSLGLIREKLGLGWSIFWHGFSNLTIALTLFSVEIGGFAVIALAFVCLIGAIAFVIQYARYSDRIKQAFSSLKWSISYIANPVSLGIIPLSCLFGVMSMYFGG